MVMVMGGRRAVKYTLEKVNGICTHICPGVLHMSLCCAAGQTSQIADALLRVAIRNSVAEKKPEFPPHLFNLQSVLYWTNKFFVF